jgi:uncharacterized protein
VTAFVATGGAGAELSRCAIAAFEMLWMTLWALAFGFLLSGAVQRFVSTEGMRRRLGDHSWRSVARATTYGAASSSCSYAAAATSRSLFAKGADAVAAFVFMVASTNLVIELGAVILGLLGWRFLAAQLVGGVVLVALLAVFGGAVLRGRVVEAARARLTGSAGSAEDSHCPIPDAPSADPRGLRTLRGWSDAAGLGLADVAMVRRELVVGFLLAGTVSVVVPAHAWSVLFFHGHGMATTVENALVAPVIAALSCVCSVGNVPLAAALWRGGIGVVGTLAFLFADVLAVPLILVYRRFYGGRLTVRLVAVLYVAIVLSALLVGGAATALGVAPASGGAHAAGGLWRSPAVTAVLNAVALAVVGGLLVARTRRRRAARPRTLPAPASCLRSTTPAPAPWSPRARSARGRGAMPSSRPRRRSR